MLQPDRPEIDFVDADRPRVEDPTKTFVAHVPANLRDPDALLSAMASELFLPSYFGFNWNALDECLRDLSWIVAKRVIVAHSDIPLSNESDRLVYLSVLLDARREWIQVGTREFEVAFPENVKDEVCGLLRRLTDE